MKKFAQNCSPFIMLLIPVFLGITLLAANAEAEIPAERQHASVSFSLPTLKTVIKAIF